ncbi:hypothetical protein H4R22_004285, partial [Coemansia sp. RSA 1290]
RDTDSGSDSEEQDGFVKVDRWKASSEPLLAAFKPTISPTNIPKFNASGSVAKSLIPRMRNPLTGTTSRTLEAIGNVGNVGSVTATKDADAGQREPKDRPKGEEAAGSESETSSSDEEISDVLDEAEIQLIEAMEDTRIAGAKDKAAGAIDKEADVKDKAASATQQQQSATKSAGCTVPQQWHQNPPTVSPASA